MVDEYKETHPCWRSRDIDFTASALPDLQDSDTEKTWQDQMRENYWNAGNLDNLDDTCNIIADFFEDLIFHKELAPNLSPSNLASIYCFLDTLQEYPHLLDEVDRNALEGADDLLQELMQRMEYIWGPKWRH